MGLVRSQGVPADLVLVGDGPERAQLEEVANDVGIREHVEFAGFQVKVDDWLSTFDVLAVSSVREGIPVAMLEAMAMGLPVVATAVGGIPEVIEDGVNGFLVQSGSPVQLAGGILNLLRCEDLRREIGSRGRKDVRRKFSREAICAEYEVLFRRLLNWSVDNV
jgi:glycosyltransferase involved in cell wall biosynthesis